jgi:Peptidase family M28
MRLLVLFTAAIAFAADPVLTPEMNAVVHHISADSLRGHLSFIASDALEGRSTPSRGLDIAAEYIAAQFRRAGLEPAGDDGYFQTAKLNVREQNPQGYDFSVTADGKTIHIDPSQTSILPDKTIHLKNAGVILVAPGSKPSAEDVLGKIVVVNGRVNNLPQGAALVLYSALDSPSGPQVADPENARRGGSSRHTVSSPDLLAAIASGEARATLNVEPAIERTVKVRNVAGILRGSDPVLKDTYVMLTAHYDHVGMRASGDDRIFNGANDDGSGTVSVIEIAGALAAQNPHPKRSILFMTFFGEERGLLGSRFYGRHPLVPLAGTIADMNLEQVGRTDASNGPQIGTASITGFDFSEVPRIYAEAGKLVGVNVYKDLQASDQYFAQSDNQALADVGVPAHALCVAFEYSDYHGVGDHWEKIDYANMAKVDGAIALAVMQLASDAPPPKWNESNSKAKKYVEAAKKLHQ